MCDHLHQHPMSIRFLVFERRIFFSPCYWRLFNRKEEATTKWFLLTTRTLVLGIKKKMEKESEMSCFGELFRLVIQVTPAVFWCTYLYFFFFHLQRHFNGRMTDSFNLFFTLTNFFPFFLLLPLFWILRPMDMDQLLPTNEILIYIYINEIHKQRTQQHTYKHS